MGDGVIGPGNGEPTSLLNVDTSLILPRVYAHLRVKHTDKPGKATSQNSGTHSRDPCAHGPHGPGFPGAEVCRPGDQGPSGPAPPSIWGPNEMVTGTPGAPTDGAAPQPAGPVHLLPEKDSVPIPGTPRLCPGRVPSCLHSVLSLELVGPKGPGLPFPDCHTCVLCPQTGDPGSPHSCDTGD